MENPTYKTPLKQIMYVKKNYHENGGKFKKMFRYYLEKHPEIDIQTFFTDEEQNDIIAKTMKLKKYHDELKIFKYIKKTT